MLATSLCTRFVVRFVSFIHGSCKYNIFCHCYSCCDLLSCDECFLLYLLLFFVHLFSFFVHFIPFCSLCSFAVFMLFAGFQHVVTMCLILSGDFYCCEIVNVLYASEIRWNNCIQWFFQLCFLPTSVDATSIITLLKSVCLQPVFICLLADK